MDIEGGAGGDELLDHERVAVRRGHDERSEPAVKSAAGLNSVRPMQLSQGPYPCLSWTSSLAPAAMSCSTTGVWPFFAALMSAVLLPRRQLPEFGWRADDALRTRALPVVALDVEVGARVD